MTNEDSNTAPANLDYSKRVDTPPTTHPFNLGPIQSSYCTLITNKEYLIINEVDKVGAALYTYCTEFYYQHTILFHHSSDLSTLKSQASACQCLFFTNQSVPRVCTKGDQVRKS